VKAAINIVRRFIHSVFFRRPPPPWLSFGVPISSK
jgi:hypothetical protein